jgi:uncharacterized protein GlcG (DUF336 family)
MRLQDARSLIATTPAEGRRRDARPFTVVVLDAGGHVVASAREDGAGLARIRIAEAKAWAQWRSGLEPAT